MTELKKEIWSIVTSAALNGNIAPDELAASLLKAAKLLSITDSDLGASDDSGPSSQQPKVPVQRPESHP